MKSIKRFSNQHQVHESLPGELPSNAAQCSDGKNIPRRVCWSKVIQSTLLRHFNFNFHSTTLLLSFRRQIKFFTSSLINKKWSSSCWNKFWKCSGYEKNFLSKFQENTGNHSMCQEIPGKLTGKRLFCVDSDFSVSSPNQVDGCMWLKRPSSSSKRLSRNKNNRGRPNFSRANLKGDNWFSSLAPAVRSPCCDWVCFYSRLRTTLSLSAINYRSKGTRWKIKFVIWWSIGLCWRSPGYKLLFLTSLNVSEKKKTFSDLDRSWKFRKICQFISIFSSVALCRQREYIKNGKTAKNFFLWWETEQIAWNFL